MNKDYKKAFDIIYPGLVEIKNTLDYMEHYSTSQDIIEDLQNRLSRIKQIVENVEIRTQNILYKRELKKIKKVVDELEWIEDDTR